MKYMWPMWSGSLFVQGALRTKSAEYRDSQNNEADKIPAITVFDAFAGWNSEDRSWGATLECDNVFETRKTTNAFQIVSGLGIGEQTYNPLRRLTFSLRHNF